MSLKGNAAMAIVIVLLVVLVVIALFGFGIVQPGHLPSFSGGK